MARLSSNLVQGLMNPSYAGRLSDSITGGVADVQAGWQQRRLREAKESMTQIMLNGDLSDPNVKNSMTAVAQQMGQDPTLATDMIDQGLQAQRTEEDQVMQKETFRMNKAKHQYTVKKNQDADALKKATAVTTARISKNPEKMEEIIQGLPADQQAAVRTAVIQKMEFDTTVAEYGERAKGKVPFTPDILEAMAETEGMEDPLAVYEKMKHEYPQGAKKLLLKQYEAVRGSELIEGRSIQTRQRPLTTTEIKNATQYVDDVFRPSKGVLEHLKDLFKPGQSMDPAVFKPAVAKRLAYKSRDPAFDPTPEAVQSLYLEVANEHAAQEEEDSTGPVTLQATDKAGFDALPEGATYIVDGKTYTKGK